VSGTPVAHSPVLRYLVDLAHGTSGLDDFYPRRRDGARQTLPWTLILVEPRRHSCLGTLLGFSRRGTRRPVGPAPPGFTFPGDPVFSSLFWRSTPSRSTGHFPRPGYSMGLVRLALASSRARLPLDPAGAYLIYLDGRLDAADAQRHDPQSVGLRACSSGQGLVEPPVCGPTQPARDLAEHRASHLIASVVAVLSSWSSSSRTGSATRCTTRHSNDYPLMQGSSGDSDGGAHREPPCRRSTYSRPRTARGRVTDGHRRPPEVTKLRAVAVGSVFPLKASSRGDHRESSSS